MKPKEIPANIVVHTPTETEAKELLAILHEGRYRSHLPGGWNMFKENTVIFIERSWINHGNIIFYKTHRGYTILTLAEFKRLYCEEEKPRPKLEVGDKVKISVPTSEFLSKYNGVITCILERQMRGDGVEGWLTELSTAYVFKDEWLTPYTEPETKTT